MAEPKTPVKKAFSSAVPNSRPVDTGSKTNLIQRLLKFIEEPEIYNNNTDCKVYMKFYQKECGKEKESDEKKTLLFESAKWMTQTFFGNLKKGRKFVRGIELNHPTTEVVNPTSLQHFEKVVHSIVSKMQTLSEDTRKKVFLVIDEKLKEWAKCYKGRRMYRMVCERKRDEKHNAAYWFFKLAYLAGTIVQKSTIQNSKDVNKETGINEFNKRLMSVM